MSITGLQSQVNDLKLDVKNLQHNFTKLEMLVWTQQNLLESYEKKLESVLSASHPHP